MPVIRASQLPPTTQAFSMNDVEKAAKGVLLKAKLQAEQLIASAMDEAEQLKEQARQEGSREGFEHGHAEGARHGTEAGRQQALKQHSAELTTLITTLRETLTQIDAHRLSIETDGTTEVVKLAITIAQRVIKRQAAIDPAVLEANVADAMKLAVSSADLRIAVHPAQRASLQESLPRLKVAFPTLKHVEIVDDTTLTPGGCRLFTRGGSIDADLGAQLDRVVAELMPVGSGGVDGWMSGSVASAENNAESATDADGATTTAPLIHSSTHPHRTGGAA